MENDIAAVALKDRICDASDRIPTSRWPFFSTTLTDQIVAPQTTAVFTFQPERDTLLTDLSVGLFNPDGELAVGEADVSIEYCNVVYAEHTDWHEWGYCCERKPIFLVGVAEDKKLKITVTLDGIPIVPLDIEVTLSGFQGTGCCS